MAQVFISYFKPEHSLTQALADDISAAGLSVWWDTQLLPDDRFRAVIDAEIESCARAIIIWTPESIQRDWVISEAEHAHRLGKLINTFAAGLDPVYIPKPFGQINAVALEDRQKIIAALSRATQASPTKSSSPSLAAASRTYPVSEAAKIVETAMRLDAEAQRQDWEQDLHDYTIHLITAAKEVLQAMDTFELEVASTNLPDFSQRVWVHRLGLAINGGRATINKEIGWLQSHPTPLVTANARNDLRFTAENLIEACCHK
jgi:hypothetical protein